MAIQWNSFVLDIPTFICDLSEFAISHFHWKWMIKHNTHMNSIHGWESRLSLSTIHYQYQDDPSIDIPYTCFFWHLSFENLILTICKICHSIKNYFSYAWRHRCSVLAQGSIWVWAPPMKEGVTEKGLLSVAEPISRMTSVVVLNIGLHGIPDVLLCKSVLLQAVLRAAIFVLRVGQQPRTHALLCFLREHIIEVLIDGADYCNGVPNEIKILNVINVFLFLKKYDFALMRKVCLGWIEYPLLLED